MTYGNLALCKRHSGRDAEAFEWSRKSIRILEPALARERRTDALEYLSNAHHNHAEIRHAQGRYRDALAAVGYAKAFEFRRGRRHRVVF